MKITKKLINSYDGFYSGSNMCSEGKAIIRRFLKKHPKGQVLNEKNLREFLKRTTKQYHGTILHGILLITDNIDLATEFNHAFTWKYTSQSEQMDYFMRITQNLEIFS